jgi:hypothetical protein
MSEEMDQKVLICQSKRLSQTFIESNPYYKFIKGNSERKGK